MISVPPPDGYKCVVDFSYPIWCDLTLIQRDVPDHSHPEEPQCSYDPVEGLTLADSANAAEKIRRLEEEVCA